MITKAFFSWGGCCVCCWVYWTVGLGLFYSISFSMMSFCSKIFLKKSLNWSIKSLWVINYNLLADYFFHFTYFIVQILSNFLQFIQTDVDFYRLFLFNNRLLFHRLFLFNLLLNWLWINLDVWLIWGHNRFLLS